MKESRVFELNQATAEQVLEAVTTFLRGEKSMEVQSVATPNGSLIQAAQADTLRTLSGMKLATTVELTVNGTQLNVTLGEGQWADKLPDGGRTRKCGADSSGGGSLSAVRGADLRKREVLQRLRRKATNGVSGLRRAGKAGQ